MLVFKDKMGQELTPKEALNKTGNRFLNILLDFELMVLRWVGHIPIHSVRNVVYRLSGIKMGTSSVIHMWANFYNPKGIWIGDDSIIGDHAFLDGRANLKIGNHVAIASQVLIYNSQHDINDANFDAEYGEVTIGDHVFIGPRVTILPGVHIGNGVVIAAGAVVTKDVSSGEIAGGIPAEKIGERKLKEPQYRLGRARLFQ